MKLEPWQEISTASSCVKDRGALKMATKTSSISVGPSWIVPSGAYEKVAALGLCLERLD